MTADDQVSGARYRPRWRLWPGSCIGLVAGGVLATLDWRAVFWINVPVGVSGTVWGVSQAARDNQRTGTVRANRLVRQRHFAVGLSAILIAVTYGIQPYGDHTMGWTDPGWWRARQPV